MVGINAHEMCSGCPALRGIEPGSVGYLGGAIIGMGFGKTVGASDIICDVTDESKSVELITTEKSIFDSEVANALNREINGRIQACDGPRKGFIAKKCGAAVVSRKYKSDGFFEAGGSDLWPS